VAVRDCLSGAGRIPPASKRFNMSLGCLEPSLFHFNGTVSYSEVTPGGRICRPLIGSYKAKRREHIQADSAGGAPCLVNQRTVPHDHIFSTVIRPRQHGRSSSAGRLRQHLLAQSARWRIRSIRSPDASGKSPSC